MAPSEADLERARLSNAERVTRRTKDLDDALRGVPATEPEPRPRLGKGGTVEWH